MVPALEEILAATKSMVFFGGAGVSTESGIPDFRSTDGLYSQSYDYPPEVILSRTFFDNNPAVFYRFYRDKMLFLSAQPNDAHKKLAQLEAAGRLTAVITQNIDNLHQKAGSKNVLELHGSVWRNYCMRCRRPYPVEKIASGTGIPKCDCGGTIKPDVVLYEESLNEKVLDGAIRSIAAADLLIVGGTSLAVYPAAGLLQYFQGDALVLINKGATPMDKNADLLIQQPIGQVLGSIKVR